MPLVPDDRLEEDGRDGAGALVADDVLEALQGLPDRSRLGLAPAVGVGVADDAHDARLVGPAARIAGQRHRAERGAVVGAVAGQDLVLAAHVAGELDGVLDRLGATEREEHLVHVARQDLGELGPELGPDLGREGRLHVLQLGRLGGDGVDDALVAVADVDRHQLAVEVEDPAALGRVEVDAFRPVDGDRVQGALHGPREDGVFARERHDLLAAHRGAGLDAHGLGTSRRVGRRWPRPSGPWCAILPRRRPPTLGDRHGSCGQCFRWRRISAMLSEMSRIPSASSPASTSSRTKTTARTSAVTMASDHADPQHHALDPPAEERLDGEVGPDQDDDREERRQDPEPDDDRERGDQQADAQGRPGLPVGASRSSRPAARVPRHGEGAPAGPPSGRPGARRRGGARHRSPPSSRPPAGAAGRGAPRPRRAPPTRAAA